jgi:hypothetical protein
MAKRTKYEPLFTQIAEELTALYGWRPGELAAVFRVDADSVQAWREKRANFKEAIERGLERFDKVRSDPERTRNVEEELYRRAVGYDYVEEKVSIGPKGKTVTTTKYHLSGDVGAQRTWLHNRDKGRWPEKVAEETGGDKTENNDFFIVLDANAMAGKLKDQKKKEDKAE